MEQGLFNEIVRSNKDPTHNPTHNPTLSPLAHKIRPTTLDDFVGQAHLKPSILKAITGAITGAITSAASTTDAATTATTNTATTAASSVILHGPPGCGKTTLALIIAKSLGGEVIALSGPSCSISDIRNASIKAEKNRMSGMKRTIVFIDEIHRFNKAQQDSLLNPIEEGKFLLIGATTENPFFGLTAPIISRSLLVELKSLEALDITQILLRAIKIELTELEISDEALKYISDHCGGDPRIALNTLEIAHSIAEPNPLKGSKSCSLEDVKEIISKNISKYDKSGDSHYDQISAFIKSMRGSDPDASLYWLARMLYSGEDPLYIARRLVIHAAEDVGLADPSVLQTAIAAQRAVETIGLPEAQIPLAMATLHIALAPKSNSSCAGIKKALAFVKSGPQALGEVPSHLKDSHYTGASQLGNEQGYLFPHNYPNGHVKQNYLPKNIENLKLMLYECSKIGYENLLHSNLSKIKEGVL